MRIFPDRSLFKRETCAALLSFWLVLTVCSAINGCILASSGASDSILKYMRRDVCVTLMLVIPFMLPRVLASPYGIVVALVFTLFTLGNGVHFLLYRSPLDWHVLASMKETHLNEIWEFIRQYIGADVVAYVLAVLVVIGFLLRFALRNPKRDTRVCLCLAVAIALGIGPAFLSRPFTQTLQRNAMCSFLFSLEEYRKEAAAFASMRFASDIPSGIRCSAPDDQLIVIVIGESSSRHHYGLYGYSRETTPRLGQRTGQLLSFTDVISPHCHTVSALYKVLTFANFDGDAPGSSVIDLFNRAGYRTFLLSNQPFLGEHETRTSTLFASCDRTFYTTGSGTGYYRSAHLDESLLPELDRVLRKEHGKSVVFLHLMGSHSRYSRRFPQDFKRFKDDPPYCIQHADVINDYDNSILYTDFILDSIIQKIESLDRPSAMLYFSDHSDAVYEDCQTAGHSESARSRFMFEIPLLLYLSPQYKKAHADLAQRVSSYTDRPWQTDDLIYSMLSLSGITFDGFKTHKDILSPDFIPEKRFLAGEDYDQLQTRAPAFPQ